MTDERGLVPADGVGDLQRGSSGMQKGSEAITGATTPPQKPVETAATPAPLHQDRPTELSRSESEAAASECSATVVIRDDHWGGFRDKCELPAGHVGDHKTPRTACEPVAYLGWPNETEGANE